MSGVRLGSGFRFVYIRRDLDVPCASSSPADPVGAWHKDKLHYAGGMSQLQCATGRAVVHVVINHVRKLVKSTRYWQVPYRACVMVTSQPCRVCNLDL